jgi:hypothetical protein
VNVSPHSQLESLEGRLAAVSTAYLMGIAAVDLLANPAARSMLAGRHATFGPGGLSFAAEFDANALSVSLDQVAHLLATPKNLEESLKQFCVVLLRDLVTIGFQLLEERSKAVGVMKELRATSFYQFARVIRNCVSHNFRIEYSNFDRSLMPLSWRGLALTRAMDGGPLPLEFFGWGHAWTLHMDYVAYARALDAKLDIVPYPNHAVTPPAR